MKEMISPEDARELVLSHVEALEPESVPLLEAVGRVAAAPLASDIDIAPFAHSAMDGFALRAEQIQDATEQSPVALRVIGEEAAGEVFEGPIGQGECVRIMTGAPLPETADAVVKYEVVGVREGDGRTGSLVEFSAPVKPHDNIRDAGEEAKAGETIVAAGEVIGAAGVGFLASCGVMQVPVYRRPRVAVIATGSELVPPSQKPAPGKIRNSNSYAMAACVHEAGGIADVKPIVKDTYEALCQAVEEATRDCDFVLTTGGAANGDYDFIKKAVSDRGELFMATVNMRPGKAQTFGLVNGVPVFGLPGNPAAAYTGFQMLVRPALRKMQGFSRFEHVQVQARLSKDMKKKDPRRIYLRSTLEKDERGYIAIPAKNQSSGLFGPIQRMNCLAILPEGLGDKKAGDIVDCLIVDIPEDVVL